MTKQYGTNWDHDKNLIIRDQIWLNNMEQYLQTGTILYLHNVLSDVHSYAIKENNWKMCFVWFHNDKMSASAFVLPGKLYRYGYRTSRIATQFFFLGHFWLYIIFYKFHIFSTYNVNHQEIKMAQTQLGYSFARSDTSRRMIIHNLNQRSRNHSQRWWFSNHQQNFHILFPFLYSFKSFHLFSFLLTFSFFSSHLGGEV